MEDLVVEYVSGYIGVVHLTDVLPDFVSSKMNGMLLLDVKTSLEAV